MGIWKNKKNDRNERDRCKPPLIIGYDYSTPEKRCETADALFSRAKKARTKVEMEWELDNDYYNFRHRANLETAEYAGDKGLPFIPAALPDPYIQVESQIDPNLPEPEFRGRDDDLDSVKAKEREYCVRFILENNRVADMNTANERRLIKLGDAFWKAYWDNDMRQGINEGDIRVKDVSPEDFYPDPAAVSLEECEYVDYVYSMHRVRFARTFAAELMQQGLTADELMSGAYREENSLFDFTLGADDETDTIQVREHWFRQPEEQQINGETIAAGVIACSIQAGGKELKYIPNYWERTWRQNRNFPFVHYWRIRDETQFWNKSELFAMRDMVDAGDRKLGSMLLNDAMLSNDIIIAEENVLADGTELTNEPGAVWLTKPGGSGKIARLGGLSHISDTSMIEWLSTQIQRANRNYESNLGRETTRQTTASGLAMLRSDADDQADIKKADRNAGFERLFELLDWLALEWYDTDRKIFIGAPGGDKDAAPVDFTYNADRYTMTVNETRDMLTGEVVRPAWDYYPRVDVTVTAGDGVIKGKQATLNALNGLIASQITAENYKLFEAQLDILDIPMREDIKADWEARFAQVSAAPAVQSVPAGAAAAPVLPSPKPLEGGNRLPGTINGVPTGL